MATTMTLRATMGSSGIARRCRASSRRYEARSLNLARRLVEAEGRRGELVADEKERALWRRERLPQILERLDDIERDLAAAHVGAPLADAPSPELAGASRTLSEALARFRPPDPRTEIARLRDDRERRDRALGAEDARQHAQAERHDRLGLRLITRSGREEGRRLRAAMERSEQAVERLGAEQGATVRQLRALEPALERRERWERELAPALSERARVLEDEIARRVGARLAEIEHEPPAYLTTALGPVPGPGRSCPERWREGAAAIEGYRERHGITDPQRALGLEAEDPLTRAERRPVERAVEDARAELSCLARALERPDTARAGPGYDHGLGQGIDRGLSQGMGR